MTAIQEKADILTVIFIRLQEENPTWGRARCNDRAMIEYYKGARA